MSYPLQKRNNPTTRVPEVFDKFYSGHWVPRVDGLVYAFELNGRFVGYKSQDEINKHNESPKRTYSWELYKQYPHWSDEHGTLIINQANEIKLYDDTCGRWRGIDHVWSKERGCFHHKDHVFYPKIGLFYLPDHQYSVYWKKWYRIDEEVPRPPATWKSLGLTLHPFITCCGMKILYGFSGTLYKTEEEAKKANMEFNGPVQWDQAFNNELEPYRGRTTGMILAVLSPTQYPLYNDLLMRHGFKLLSKHPNLNHGVDHMNYLYGWGCHENRNAIVEAVKAFSS